MALDLTQDVLVRMLSRPVPSDPAQLKSYAMKSAYNAALNALRDRKRQARIFGEIQEEAESHSSVLPEFAEVEDAEQTRRHLGVALKKLPAKQREAVEYRFYGDLKTDEIAAAMNVSSGSVKTHLYRALNRLSELMKTTKLEK
jgi:RNA polymerase sigma-70 factor (ECF subfamily)